MMETIQKEAEKADTFRRLSGRMTPIETEDEYDDSSEESDSDRKTQKKLERVLNKKLNEKKTGGFCSIFKCFDGSGDGDDVDGKETSFLIEEYLKNNIRKEMKRQAKRKKKRRKQKQFSIMKVDYLKPFDDLSVVSETRQDSVLYDVTPEPQQCHRIHVENIDAEFADADDPKLSPLAMHP